MFSPAIWAQDKIVHDGEFEFLEQQHKECWAADDKAVDARSAGIRKKNGGKRPSILYILVDDVPFGDFGMPELDYVRATKTPNINRLAAFQCVADLTRSIERCIANRNDSPREFIWTAKASDILEKVARARKKLDMLRTA